MGTNKNNGFPTCLEHCTSESKTLHSGRQWNVFPILCWSTFRIGTRITSSSFGWCYLCDSYTCKAIARQSIQKTCATANIFQSTATHRALLADHASLPKPLAWAYICIYIFWSAGALREYNEAMLKHTRAKPEAVLKHHERNFIRDKHRDKHRLTHSPSRRRSSPAPPPTTS